MKYYSIRIEHTDSSHRAGEQVLNADNPLRIGQTSFCDIRLDNPSQYEDTVLAVIEKRHDGRGWKLIRLSPFKEHGIRVNGTAIDYVHFLNDGDRIAFEGLRQELCFNIREDDHYTSDLITTVHMTTSRSSLIWLGLLTLLLLGFIAHLYYSRPMTPNMVDRAKESVFKIMVDSIRLTVSLNSIILSEETQPINNTFGTAFLTSDGKVVTARHCIEPWLNIPEAALLDSTILSEAPFYVDWAVKAATRNIMTESGYDSVDCLLTSYCSLLKPELGDSVLLNLSSTDFQIDKSRDGILEFGDYSHQYYWRSISVRPRRIDMMLDDIAYLPDADKLLPHYKGTIRLASKEEMRKICQKSNQHITILGRATTDIGNKQIQSLNAKLSITLNDNDFSDEGYPNVVLSHEGNIKPGFSGGPVLIRHGFFGWRAIGIVSVKDKNDNNRYYSVPVTEIERMTTKRKPLEP